ncbi:hypothetical protein CCAX7_31720 [Capsulimonas corticalis]|uniref:beta-fructofuranosidase n=1 Tax=Capsulimonas corticalis TaxID=2219043 RepID=A0A402CSD2_9BACT|nr:hypothetical protein CCAX7_31720 [Capsulimonas corticalis]
MLLVSSFIGVLISANTSCAALAARLPRSVASVKAHTPGNKDDITIADFEGARYPDGWTTTGTAFGLGPAHGAIGGQQAVTGFVGQGLVNSYFGAADGATGTLTSPPFVIGRKYLSFLIGGGRHPAQTRIDLLVNGVSQRTATGGDSEQLARMQWDVGDLKGKTAQIQITDSATGQWGHINIDAITLTDHKLPDERTRLLASAMEAIRAAVPTAEADARRPAYHFHAPAQWMNDPNGPIYDKGWHHIFYQFNPYGAKWGNMHWGHARSKDMVNWEQMSAALWPSKSAGEDHVYSGSVFPRADGTPMAFYTSIGDREPEQWGAVAASGDLATWRKSAENPLVSGVTNGADKIAEWRDPFLFSENGATYMVTGGGLNGRGVVLMYQAINPNLTSWQYLGPIFHHPDAAISNIECPNIARLDGKWLLLTSTYGKVESFVGQLDLKTHLFTTEKRGVLADGSYASQLTHDAAGDLIYYGWMHTEQGSGWNGYLTLPSTLRIAPDGTVIRKPIAKFESLRGKHIHLADHSLASALDLTGQLSGKSLELIADIDPGTATSVTIHLRPGSAADIHYDAASRALTIPHRDPVTLPADSDLKLRIFVDNGALDVYAADGAVTLAAFLDEPLTPDAGVRITSDGGAATVKNLDAYEMKPAVIDDRVFGGR